MNQLGRAKVDKKSKMETKKENKESNLKGAKVETASAVEAQKELSVEELTDLLKRTQANFENYRKQNQTYIEELRKMAARDIVLQLLPIIDNFELALKAASKENANKELLQGVELIHSQLMNLLQQHQVMSIETIGKNFDPYCHEALMKVPSELPANKIIEEFQKGFTMQGKVLRHAKVKISSGTKPN